MVWWKTLPAVDSETEKNDQYVISIESTLHLSIVASISNQGMIYFYTIFLFTVSWLQSYFTSMRGQVSWLAKSNQDNPWQIPG